MVDLRWTRENVFADHKRGFVAREAGVYDVPEEAVDEYLDHRSGAWERVEDDTDSSDTEDADASTEESDTEPDADQDQDQDLEEMDYRELQDVAQQYDIKANQSADELRAAIREEREA